MVPVSKLWMLMWSNVWIAADVGKLLGCPEPRRLMAELVGGISTWANKLSHTLGPCLFPHD